MKHTRPSLLARLLLGCIPIGLTFTSASNAEEALPGYHTPEEIISELKALEQAPVAQVISLGKTAQGREIVALRVSSAVGDPDSKPAIAVFGAVHAPQRMASELTLDLARDIRSMVSGDNHLAEVDRVTWYFVPEPSPDSAAATLSAPFQERSTNTRPWDDDRDGEVDEDGPDDLNGDGWITQMRVKDGSGPWFPHPQDNRVMIVADKSKGEEGGWSILTEGYDNDGDGQFNEDPAGGVDFNRNFSWQYPDFTVGSGLNPVSEPENRAVADFLFSHPNVAIVYSISPQENLAHQWRPAQGGQGPGYKGIDGQDETYYKLFADTFAKYCKDLTGREAGEAPGPADASGSFAAWAYYHFGRWSVSSPGWWTGKPTAEEVTPVVVPDPATSSEAAVSEPAVEQVAGTPDDPASAPPADSGWDNSDSRGQEERDRLKWLEQQGIDAFAPWTAVQHDGLDELWGSVEVGGFKTLRLINPPYALLGTGISDSADDHSSDLFTLQSELLARLFVSLPKLEIDRIKTQALGGGVCRLSLRLINNGELPTMSQLGAQSGITYPLQVSLNLPAGASIISGKQRQPLPRLDGNGGSIELSWLLSCPQGGMATVEAGSIMSGQTSREVELAAGGAN